MKREERQVHRSGDVHVVGPHRHGQRRDRERRVDQGRVPEDRLAGEHRQDLGDDAEERQRDDVDLRVAEEPEQVLPEHGAAGGGVEDVRCRGRGRLRARAAPRQHGKAISTRIEVTRMFQVKIGIRNIVIPGARIVTMVVMKFTAPRIVRRGPACTGPTSTGRRRRPGLWIASDERARRRTSRRTAAPSGREEARAGDQRAEQVQPVGEARSGAGTPRRGRRSAAERSRSRSREHRRREHQQHDRAVHGEELVERLVVDELQARLRQSSARTPSASRPPKAKKRTP